MNYAKDLTKDYTASYAQYVATSRAIPRLVDGLKPVARRCINSASDLKIFHDKKFLKVAKLNGQVLGDYHPHGGANMVLLAQPWSIRYPLFEGQGNFGSPDGDPPAAERYIETRLTKFCEDFYLSSADYADKEDNYDGRLKEITQYYPPIPGSLLTGSSGIAVGLSTNIPSHRISDICQSLLSYLENPKSDDYLRLTPETCEESIILTPREEIKKMYLKGEGSIQYKAKTHYESIDGKLALVVDAFPPDYSKKRLETSYIMDAVESGNLELRNESSTHIRYVFLSTDKEVLSVIEERLTSSTGYRFYIENNNKIHLYKLNELYDEFIEARKVYVVRKYFDLIMKNELELEFIRVLLEFKRDKDYLLSMFEKSPKDVVSHIIKKYTTTESVANRIISSSLSSMMKDNSEKLKLKYEELSSQNKEYKRYVEDPLYKIILDIKSLYKEYKGEERRALHIDDISDKIIIDYNGSKIETTPSTTFYLATKDNHYSEVHAAELLDINLKDKILTSSEYEYYVFYDKKGLVAVTKEIMSKLDNKFKSDTLVGILGTNDLSTVKLIRSENKRVLTLGDWALRKRQSYIQQVETGYIELAQD